MRWTKEYDRIIAESLVDCKSVLHSAFELTQRRLIKEHGIVVSRKAISSRYYRNTKDIEDVAREILSSRMYTEYLKLEKKHPWYKRLWSKLKGVWK